MGKDLFRYIIPEFDESNPDLYYEKVEEQIIYNRTYFNVSFQTILEYFGGTPFFNSGDDSRKISDLEFSFAVYYKPGSEFYQSTMELFKANNLIQMKDELFVICSFLADSIFDFTQMERNYRNHELTLAKEDAASFKKLFEYVKINVIPYRQVKCITITTDKGDFSFSHEDSIHSLIRAISKIDIKSPVFSDALKFDESLNLIILRLYHFITEKTNLKLSDGRKTSVHVLSVIHGILDLTGYLRKMNLETDIHFVSTRIHRLLKR
ncbi:MAG: hypothetical protein U0Y08_05810 [Bacteroidia bacterium]